MKMINNVFLFAIIEVSEHRNHCLPVPGSLIMDYLQKNLGILVSIEKNLFPDMESKCIVLWST